MKDRKMKNSITTKFEEINAFAESIDLGYEGGAICDFEQMDEVYNYSVAELEIGTYKNDDRYFEEKSIVDFAEKTLGVKFERVGDGNGDCTVIHIYRAEI